MISEDGDGEESRMSKIKRRSFDNEELKDDVQLD